MFILRPGGLIAMHPATAGGIRPPGSCPRGDARADARPTDPDRRVSPVRPVPQHRQGGTWQGCRVATPARGHSPDAIPASAPGDPRARALRECVGRLHWAAPFRWGLCRAPHAQLQGIKSRDAPAIEILEYLGDRSGAPWGANRRTASVPSGTSTRCTSASNCPAPGDRATRLRHRTATA